MRMRSSPATVFGIGIVLVVLGGCGDDDGGSGVTETEPSVTVTSPNGGEAWYYEGVAHDITWVTTKVPGDVDIYYTVNDGGAWKNEGFNIPNTGSYTWTIPNEDSPDCRVRVQEAGGLGPSDVSNALFTIAPATVTVTAPNTGEAWPVGSPQDITWTAAGPANVKIELTRTGGASWEVIAASTDASAGTYPWTVTGSGSTNCRIRVSDAADDFPTDQSDVPFAISSITVFLPNGGEEWYYQGRDQTISWSTVGAGATVDISYSVDGGAWNTFAPGAANTGSYLWTIPNEDSAQCLVRVEETGGTGAGDQSNAVFSIAPATVTVVTPNGGQNWVEGSSELVEWTATGVLNVRVEVSRNGGSIWQTVAASVVAATGSHPWTVTTPSSSNCLVRVSDAASLGNSDRSNAAFTIAPLFFDTGAPLTGVTSPALAWGDYDSDGDLDLVIAGYPTVGLASKLYTNTGGVFAEDTGVSLTGCYNCAVAWGDYDNDGDIDLALSGQGTGTDLYQNDAGAFTDVTGTTSLMNVVNSALAWGDYDNNGDFDLAISGLNSPTRYSRIYVNGGGNFNSSGLSLVDVEWGSLAWGDYDLDGDLDLALAGESSGGNMSFVYVNTAGSLSPAGAGLAGVGSSRSAIAWGDYNNDGILDLALAGATTTSSPYSPVSKIYQGNGVTFTDIGASLTGVWACSLAWGDYDNDGDLDLVISGRSGSSWITRLYRNDAGSFVNSGVELPDLGRSAVAWGDCDGDYDLDLAIAGSAYESDRSAKVLRNDCPAANTPPTAPTGLPEIIAVVSPGVYDVTFSWTSSSDDWTPPEGLSYNLRVGTTSDGNEVHSGMAASGATGRRRIAARGMVQPGPSTNEWTLRLPADTYYWSVQAIDTSFVPSPWATQRTLVVP